MSDMSVDAYKQLKTAYLALKKNIEQSRLPVILLLSKKRANERSKLLRESAIDANYIDKELKDELIEGGYVQEIKNTTLLSLTAKSIWTVQSKEENITVDELVSGIDELYYDNFKSVKIKSTHKIVAFTMISMRSFSIKSCIDVKENKNVSEYWWGILLEVNDFLVKMGVVPEKESLKNKKTGSGIESNASNLIRHCEDLNRYTNGIYSYSGKNQYWIEIIENNRIDLNKLSFLIKQILKDDISLENCDDYWKFANNLCLNHRYEIESSYEDDSYLSCGYDDDIHHAFKKAVDIKIN